MDLPSLATIPARKGKACRMAAGQLVKVINTHGQQVVDTWEFNSGDITERMSMEHSRTCLGKITPDLGDSLVTNRRRPILTLVEDISGGIHDTYWRRATATGMNCLGFRGSMTTVPIIWSLPWQN